MNMSSDFREYKIMPFRPLICLTVIDPHVKSIHLKKILDWIARVRDKGMISAAAGKRAFIDHLT